MIKSDNKGIMINDEVDKVIKELLHSVKNGPQNNLESMKLVSYFFFYLGFLSQTFSNHRTEGEGEGHFLKLSTTLSTRFTET